MTLPLLSRPSFVCCTSGAPLNVPAQPASLEWTNQLVGDPHMFTGYMPLILLSTLRVVCVSSDCVVFPCSVDKGRIAPVKAPVAQCAPPAMDGARLDNLEL